MKWPHVLCAGHNAGMNAALKSRTMAVRAVLVAWDPLSVFRTLEPGDDAIDAIRDEYDDLALPLLGRLERGESSAELAAFIETMLDKSYGLGPGRGDWATGLIDALQGWWAADPGCLRSKTPE
jgi:hypothetical protein